MTPAESPTAHSGMGKRTTSATSTVMFMPETGSEAAKLYKPQYGMSNYICTEPHAARPQLQFWCHDCTCQLAVTVMVMTLTMHAHIPK